MPDPEVRYTRTEDGLSIAYTTFGAGEPLVITPPLGYSHLSLELQFAPLRAWYERLARRHTLVRFDWRAQGLSERNVPTPPRAWGLIDLAAVVDAVGIERVDLLGCGTAGFRAAQYASAAAQRVRKLILWSVPADGGDWGSRDVQIATTLASQDYRMFTETIAATILGFDDPASHAWAQFMRRAMNETDHHTIFSGPDQPATPNSSRLSAVEAREILARVAAPTLVLHPVGMFNMPVENAQALAASVPNARLVLCREDRSGLPTGDEATAAIEIFLDGTASEPVRPEAVARAAGMAVILFADIADSTALTERMGDAAFRAKSRALDDALRTAVRNNGGNVIDAKTLGDGILATFPAASQAIAAALACATAGESQELPLHLGLHAGDVIREEGNVFGGAVNIAARISALAAPGEVLVSRTVADLARTSGGVTFDDRGEHAFKGIDEPQRVFAIHLKS